MLRLRAVDAQLKPGKGGELTSQKSSPELNGTAQLQQTLKSGEGATPGLRHEGNTCVRAVRATGERLASSRRATYGKGPASSWQTANNEQLDRGRA